MPEGTGENFWLMPKVSNTADFIREMQARGFSHLECETLIIGARWWAKSDHANREYAYPTLFMHRIRETYWRTRDTSKETIMEWYRRKE